MRPINCLHESCHCVCAAAVGLPVGGVSESSCLLAKSDTAGTRIQNIVATLAPYFLDPDGSKDDIQAAASLIEELPFPPEFYWRIAKTIVERPDVIRATRILAEALEEHGSLSPEEITALIDPILFKEGENK